MAKDVLGHRHEDLSHRQSLRTHLHLMPAQLGPLWDRFFQHRGSRLESPGPAHAARNESTRQLMCAYAPRGSLITASLLSQLFRREAIQRAPVHLLRSERFRASSPYQFPAPTLPRLPGREVRRKPPTRENGARGSPHLHVLRFPRVERTAEITPAKRGAQSHFRAVKTNVRLLQ